MKQEQRAAGKIRIIAGNWRGRKITLSANPALRPTPARVRETLFNWLQPLIEGANCLDLFAGSGALGFEALSRGAASVTMVEFNKREATRLEKQAQELGAEGCKIICDEALHYLSASAEQFDLIFLDPPFTKNLLEKTCEALQNGGHLASGAHIYVEDNAEIDTSASYTILKQARAGNVYYALLQSRPERETK